MESFSTRTDVLPINEVPLALILLVVAAVAYRLIVQTDSPKLDHIPVLGSKADFGVKSLDILTEGYAKFKKSAFQVFTSEGSRIVLGQEEADELKKLPDTIVDHVGPIRESMSFDYTMLPDPTDQVALRSIKIDLTQKLHRLNERIAEEVDHAIAIELPDCKDWTPINVYSTIARIVSRASTRIFLGEEMCRNEEWINLSIDYTRNVFNGSQAIKKWRPALRPFVYRFVPELQKVYQDRATAYRLLMPIIKARREAEGQDDYEKPDDILQWTMDARIKKHDRDRDYEHMCDIQLGFAFAAIHTTTSAVTHMFYDLAAMPEYVSILRQEANEELAKNGGEWGGNLMKSLKMTDSFMKESQRNNPMGLISFVRRMRQDYTLQNGTFLPKGATVATNSYSIGQDAGVLKGESAGFDGLRYYRRGQQVRSEENAKEAAGKHQFVSISSSSMHFGYGRHACPGRFFAGNEIKLILIKMLERYDIRPEGESGKRYENFRWEAQNMPDPTKNVLLRAVDRDTS